MPIKGNLKDFKLEEVVQMITAGKKSGKLEINSKGRRYRVYFKNGEILHASAPFSNGEDAIKDIFLEENGRFEFIQNIVLPPKTINKSTMEIIFNGMSVREDCKEVKEVFTGDKKLHVSTDVGDRVSISETEWKILKRLAEGETLDQILEKEELSYYKACIILRKIIEKGLIKIS